MRILGVVGSLRARSSNAAVLRAAATVAPAGVAVELWQALDTIAPFNPDLDQEGMTPPPPVAHARAQLAAADAVLLCSPEYAHGVPGTVKNLLDWMVSAVELIGKRVAVIGVGPGGGVIAQAQLVETLRTMSWQVVDAACATLALGAAQFDVRGELADPAVLAQLRGCVASLARGG